MLYIRLWTTVGLYYDAMVNHFSWASISCCCSVFPSGASLPPLYLFHADKIQEGEEWICTITNWGLSSMKEEAIKHPFWIQPYGVLWGLLAMTSPVQRAGLTVTHVNQFKECICCGFWGSALFWFFLLALCCKQAWHFSKLGDFYNSCACPSDQHMLFLWV